MIFNGVGGGAACDGGACAISSSDDIIALVAVCGSLVLVVVECTCRPAFSTK